MNKKKTLDELTLMDDYMFVAVMENTEFLRPLLEFILGVKIKKIEFTEPQKTEKKGYQSKGVRLDLYVVDENGNIYNVEVQTTNERHLPKRMRYYQSIIDISILNPGDLYNELRKSFVIFICNYDPFERGRYIYTFENICKEEPDLTFGDETTKVIVNTHGTKGEISAELKEIIMYLKDEEITGNYSQALDDAVNAVKGSEERRREYMMLNMRDNEIREEGREEGKILQAIKMYRDLVHYSDEQIIETVMKEFKLTKKEAESYLKPAFA
ncbi:MAG: Rpn family recombination-promoting nuclease/putative transposase [Anaerolineaceae bacterium]|nr:Rpn family recombination-promoting nuclease/putative transposase [Anaerolineaceae bacterium]